eukprot:763001-Hanusia_phi.AAC.4
MPWMESGWGGEEAKRVENSRKWMFLSGGTSTECVACKRNSIQALCRDRGRENDGKLHASSMNAEG